MAGHLEDWKEILRKNSLNTQWQCINFKMEMMESVDRKKIFLSQHLKSWLIIMTEEGVVFHEVNVKLCENED